MKRFPFIFSGILFLSLLARVLPAQELAPKDPDIVLPPMLLELEDLYEEQIQAALPDFDDTLSYEIDVPLPQPSQADAAGPAPQVAIPSPGGLEPGKTGVSQSGGKGPSFFTSGKIGIGSMNNIFGNVTLYKLGEDPHFHLQFGHEKIDGYNFRPAGAGYFHQENTLSGGFSLKPENVYFDINASYGEISEGLQNLGIYSSVLHRPITVDSRFLYDAGGLFTFKADLDTAFTQETLSGAVPVNTQEFSIVPRIRGGLSFGNVSLGLSAEYEYRSVNTAGSGLHRVKVTWDGSAEVKGNLVFGADLSIDWHTSRQIEIPFSLFLQKGFSDILSFRIEGGYKTHLARYYDLWKEFTFYQLYSNTPYPDVTRWYGLGKLDWNIVKQLTLSASGEFSRYTSVILPAGSYDATTGLVGFSLDQLTQLETSAGLSWESLKWLSTGIKWTGRFIQQVPSQPSQLLSWEIRMHTLSGKWGGGLKGNFSVLTTPRIPEVNINLFFAPTEGVEFSLQGLDLFAPLISGGRKDWGFYEMPGFRVVFVTSISL